MSGEGKFPVKTSLLGNGLQPTIPKILAAVDPSGSDIQAAFADHLFDAAAPPGTVCIAALMNATLVAKSVALGGAIQ